MVIKQLCMSKSNKQPPSYFIQNWKNFVIVLANSVNANCCPFQVKNICSKFITKIYRDRPLYKIFVHYRWTSTTVPHDLVNFFICNIEKHMVWCISAKKTYCNLTKNNRKIQASVSKRCISLSRIYGILRQNPLNVPVKMLNL